MFRLLKIEIDGIKTIGHGEILFPEAAEYKKYNFVNPSSGIVGVYGQNGSGKTSVIDCLFLLNAMVNCMPIQFENDGDISNASAALNHLISLQFSESGKAKLIYTFLSSQDPSSACLITYTIVIALSEKKDGPSVPFAIKEEIFEATSLDGIKKRKHALFSPVHIVYQDGAPFSLGQEKYDKLLNDSFNERVEATANYLTAIRTNASLLFYAPQLEILRKISKKEEKPFEIIAKTIKSFANQIADHLYIMTTGDYSMTTLGFLPISVARKNDDQSSKKGNSLGLKMVDVRSEEPFVVDEKGLLDMKSFSEKINELIPVLIPGFVLKLDVLGDSMTKDGKPAKRIEFYRDLGGGKKIPLSCESDGTKKIICLCEALIEMYNDDSTIVAIDELDSGVFEMLLGQLVTAISDGALGQLIFTSHNLRSMEVLSVENVYVTTTNANNKFITLKGLHIRKTNNLRDQYYKALFAGGLSEEIYKQTDTFDISNAMRKIGSVPLEENSKE